ncbi:hypothetical protein V2W45_1471697 [Cenococcum geophilum]
MEINTYYLYKIDLIIKIKPIKEGLNSFRNLFNSTYKDLGVSNSLDALPASRLLPSYSGNKNLFGNLSRLNSAVNSNDFNIEYFANSSKYRKYIDNVLKEKLGPLYVRIPSLYKVFFRGVKGLKEPKGAKERKVLKWFNKLIISFLDFVKEHGFVLKLHILVLGELKSNPNTNIALKARFNLGKYIREVFAA